MTAMREADGTRPGEERAMCARSEGGYYQLRISDFGLQNLRWRIADGGRRIVDC
jgi:hypothetical protein